jgi:prepilin-type processing-associated H-X9-DG protein
MLEVLISLGVIGVLFALILPAVQNTREAARRLKCLSNLKQLGIATENFIESRGRLPTGGGVLVELLPFVEGPTVEDAKKGVNLPLFACPSDEAIPNNLSVASYRMNDGSQLAQDRDRRRVSFRNGVYKFTGLVKDLKGPRPADFTDGLSTTALFSERRYRHEFGGNSGDACQADPIRCLWFIRERFFVGEEDAFVAHCREDSNRTGVTPVLWSEPISIFGLEECYHHILPPNAVGCYSFPVEDAAISNDGAIPPTSRHPGGVNVSFCDGSARFVGNGISNAIWRALGSRNGNEVVGEF